MFVCVPPGLLAFDVVFVCFSWLKMKSTTIVENDKGKKSRRERETNRKKNKWKLSRWKRNWSHTSHQGDKCRRAGGCALSPLVVGESHHCGSFMGKALSTYAICLSGWGLPLSQVRFPIFQALELRHDSRRLLPDRALEVSQSQTWEPPT